MGGWSYIKGAKNAYTVREVNVIRRKLGIPLNAPLPKCPAKSSSFVRRREKLGDFSHSGRTHFCAECACGKTAGAGTDHYGYGWCHTHERSKRRKRHAKEFALKHMEAIQQRHPSLYHKMDKFFEMVEAQGNQANQTQTLESEIKLLRATILEMMERIKDGEATSGYDPKTGCTRKMTDKDKVAVVKQLSEAIGKLVKTDSDIHSDNFITLDSFKVWMAAFARAVREQFPAKEEQLKFVEASKKAGEPKRG
jgi:hypothetical protein